MEGRGAAGDPGEEAADPGAILEPEGAELAAAAGGVCPSDTELAGYASQCQSCPGMAMCQSQGTRTADPDQKLIDLRMNACKRRILVLSGKGGVGKSSVASWLAMALAHRGKKVGLADVDLCGPSAPQMLGVAGQAVVNTNYGWQPLVSPNHGVKVLSVGSLMPGSSDQAVIWRGPRKTNLLKRFVKDTFWGRLDYLLFDTPPGTSDEHLAVVKYLSKRVPVSGAVLVMTPQPGSLDTIRKSVSFCAKLKIPVLGIVENMAHYVCPNCTEKHEVFSNGSAERLSEMTSLPILASLPISPSLMMCAEQGQSPFEGEAAADDATRESLLALADAVAEAAR